MTDPIKLMARGPRASCEAAAAAIDADPMLEALSYCILEESEPDGWRIDAYPQEDEVAPLRDLMAEHDISVVEEILADADWLAMALSGLPPVRAGRFFVYGAHDRGAVPQSSVALRIEAGAAFGTGHHGTTEGCLSAFDRILKQGSPRRVLDVGTGTGVLAIAAAKTGSTTVVATDIDRVSVRIARENAALNMAAISAFHANGLGHPDVRRHGPYDLVFANILAQPLIWLAPQIVRATAPGGTIILSGLLSWQARSVKAAYRTQGAHLSFAVRRDPWVTLVFRT